MTAAFSLPPSLRKAWISGASSGLGRALTEACLAAGLEVWGTSRQPGRLADFVSPRFHPVVMDLNATEAALAAYRTASAEAGGFDLVIHNAGYGVFGALEHLPDEVWHEQLTSLLITVPTLVRASYADLRRQGRGSLVLVSSVAVDYPLPFLSGYNTAKAALSGLSESLIYEARGSGVQVVDLRPGDIRTSFNEAVLAPQKGAEADPRLTKVWATLQKNLASAPGPEVVVKDVMKAVGRGRSGVFYTGGWFQTRLAILFARWAPAGLRRAVAARYFGLS